MTCANTSLPAYIRCSRDGFPRRVANLATAVQVGDRQNHEKVLSVPWLTSRSLENVGTLLHLNINLLTSAEMSDSCRKTFVVPAKAGTQRRSSKDTGFPPS